MIKQKVVRTYPKGCGALQEALSSGWRVFMVNKFDIVNDYNGKSTEVQGNEYILEKECGEGVV